MKWHREYAIGIAVVDAQHKRLFEMVAELNLALRSGLKHSDVKRLLEALAQYAKRHFNLEERYMHESGYPGISEQLAAHAFFTKRFADLHETLSTQGLTPQIVYDIKDELSHWIRDHVTGLDSTFGKFYTSR